jgi:hypothetical protein
MSPQAAAQVAESPQIVPPKPPLITPYWLTPSLQMVRAQLACRELAIGQTPGEAPGNILTTGLECSSSGYEWLAGKEKLPFPTICSLAFCSTVYFEAQPDNPLAAHMIRQAGGNGGYQ